MSKSNVIFSRMLVDNGRDDLFEIVEFPDAAGFSISLTNIAGTQLSTMFSDNDINALSTALINYKNKTGNEPSPKRRGRPRKKQA